MPYVVTAIITFIITAPLAWLAAVAYRKKVYEGKIGSAEEKSREIIDEALKTAETKKREALLEAKRNPSGRRMSWRRRPGRGVPNYPAWKNA